VGKLGLAAKRSSTAGCGKLRGRSLVIRGIIPKGPSEAVKKYVQETVGKPEVVKELEKLFGVVGKKNGSGWSYFPS